MNRVLHISVIISLFYSIETAISNVNKENMEDNASNNMPHENAEKPDKPVLTENLQISDPITAPPITYQNDTENQIQLIANLKKYEFSKSLTPIMNEDGIHLRIYKIISDPIFRFLRAPKVSIVLRNIGTCIVNGAMEIFSYYLPTPFMPMVATLASLAIPFEPVVMLKEKMPVTSYRRAFKTAMNSFLRTFDQYKLEEDDYDPYMTRRFNRRFSDDNSKKKEER